MSKYDTIIIILLFIFSITFIVTMAAIMIINNVMSQYHYSNYNNQSDKSPTGRGRSFRPQTESGSARRFFSLEKTPWGNNVCCDLI